MKKKIMVPPQSELMKELSDPAGMNFQPEEFSRRLEVYLKETAHSAYAHGMLRGFRLALKLNGLLDDEVTTISDKKESDA